MIVSAKSAMYIKHAQLMQARCQNYFDIPSNEVLSLIPKDAKRVLEIGCGTGATLGALKAQRLAEGSTCEVVGVDIDADSVVQAREHLDAVYLMDAEEGELTDYPKGYFDVLIMHFVLEHFVNPWATLRQWLLLLRRNGYAIISVPNIANYRFLERLVFHDEFTHEPFGVLDWTHLRYFTKRSLNKLLTDANLTITTFNELPSREQMRKRIRYSIYLFPFLRRFIYFAYIVVAQKGELSLPTEYVPFEEMYTLL